ncbi:GIY-YIG nuclease family protein [Gluconobacter cerinus]|nr:GIY-YIG nuclease family protein [Gluconobacter cerinus]
MSEHPQTIQIFLPSGDPQGIRTAAITTRIVQVIEIPRVRLESFLAMPEAGFVGVYVLFGENEQTSAPMAYVGQTGNLGTRLKQHNEKKDF